MRLNKTLFFSFNDPPLSLNSSLNGQNSKNEMKEWIARRDVLSNHLIIYYLNQNFQAFPFTNSVTPTALSSWSRLWSQYSFLDVCWSLVLCQLCFYNSLNKSFWLSTATLLHAWTATMQAYTLTQNNRHAHITPPFEGVLSWTIKSVHLSTT